jgi:hypothetical protein
MSAPNLNSDDAAISNSNEMIMIPLRSEDDGLYSRGKLTKTKSYDSMMSLGDKLKNSKRMPANPIIYNMMRQDRISILEHGNSAITRVPDLTRCIAK